MGHLINGGLLCFSADHDLSPSLHYIKHTVYYVQSINQSIAISHLILLLSEWYSVCLLLLPLHLLCWVMPRAQISTMFPTFFFCVRAASFMEIIITVGSPIRDWFEGFPLSLARVTHRISPGPRIWQSPSVVVVSTVPYHHSMCINQSINAGLYLIVRRFD